jgi:glycosyltransferase involved in cell wall biosynthesis
LRIVQYLSGPSPWGDVTPETMNSKGLGGRETALVQLAQRWAHMGYDVVNYVPVEAPTGPPNCRFLDYRYVADHLRCFGADVLVSWEEPRIFDIEGVAESVPVKVIEMQVAHLSGLTPEADQVIDAYAVLSRWAGGFLTQQNAFVDPRKLVVLPNGVDLDRYRPELAFDYPEKVATEKSWRFFYSSSPDRGLAHLLNTWPRIRDRWPNATLTICYGLENWVRAEQWSHNIQSESALDIIEGLEQPGINYLGKIGQSDLADIQRHSDALLYPCDTMQPTETGCITVVEAGAAWSPAIITDCDCLGSEFGDYNYAAVSPLPFDPDHYVDTIDSVLSDKDRYLELQRNGRELARSRQWSLIAEDWIDMFDRVGDKVAAIN